MTQIVNRLLCCNLDRERLWWQPRRRLVRQANPSNQRPAALQATVGAGRMMIPGDWRDFRDAPPTSGPYFLAAAVLVAAWMIILTILLAALMMRFL